MAIKILWYFLHILTLISTELRDIFVGICVAVAEWLSEPPQGSHNQYTYQNWLSIRTISWYKCHNPDCCEWWNCLSEEWNWLNSMSLVPPRSLSSDYACGAWILRSRGRTWGCPANTWGKCVLGSGREVRGPGAGAQLEEEQVRPTPFPASEELRAKGWVPGFPSPRK